MSAQIQENVCLGCGAALDAATHLQDESKRPREGDISVCVYCGAMAFTEDGFLREATVEELATLPEPIKIEIARIRVAARALNLRERKKRNLLASIPASIYGGGER